MEAVEGCHPEGVAFCPRCGRCECQKCGQTWKTRKGIPPRWCPRQGCSSATWQKKSKTVTPDHPKWKRMNEVREQKRQYVRFYQLRRQRDKLLDSLSKVCTRLGDKFEIQRGASLRESLHAAVSSSLAIPPPPGVAKEPQLTRYIVIDGPEPEKPPEEVIARKVRELEYISPEEAHRAGDRWAQSVAVFREP